MDEGWGQFTSYQHLYPKNKDPFTLLSVMTGIFPVQCPNQLYATVPSATTVPFAACAKPKLFIHN